MKNKSLILFENLEEAAKKALQWGQIIFESYYKRDESGNIQESTPTTSEFISAFWWPYVPDVDNAEIKIEGLTTGQFIETFTDARGVITERIVFKPRETVEKEQFLQALDLNFQKHHKPENKTLDNFKKLLYYFTR